MAAEHIKSHSYPIAELNDWMALGSRVMKAALVLSNPPDVDVGTTPADVVYRENKLSLLHYRPIVDRRNSPPVLLVYALINKPYIMDLQPDRSVVRSLLERGFDVYLIDWGLPSDADRSLTLDDYVNGYIDRCVDEVLERAGVDRLTLFGYCMGGTMATMYAALYPKRVRNLIIMAAPIKGDVDEGILHIWSRKEWYDVDKIVEAFGNVPGEFINLGYNILEPINNYIGKLLLLMKVMDDEDRLKNFLRMERWTSDGIPLAGETFRQFLKDIYQDDLLIKGKLRLGNRKVDLKRIDMPLLLILGQRDHLVPPTSTLPLAELVSSDERETYDIPAGHIGISMGTRAHKELWPKVAEWLEDRSEGPDGTGTTGAGEASKEAAEEGTDLTGIKGIGVAYAKKLEVAGVRTVEDLLGADPLELSKQTGIAIPRIKSWREQTGV